MKKIVLALTTIAAFTGSAIAADMAPRPYSKAPPPMVAPVASWTGCWISGGGGYAISKIDHDTRSAFDGFVYTQNVTTGADGYLATAGVGCDYQFSGRWVVGGFVDGTWSSIKGDYEDRLSGIGGVSIGQTKQDWAWAVGGRVGYLVSPSFLSYFNAGFTEAHLKAIDFYGRNNDNGGLYQGLQLPGQTVSGFFIGSGFEYALDFLPGLFVKTEGRASVFNRKDAVPFCAAAGTSCVAPGVANSNWFNFDAGNTDSRHLVTYAAKTELVYRFNWGGPIAARY